MTRPELARNESKAALAQADETALIPIAHQRERGRSVIALRIVWLFIAYIVLCPITLVLFASSGLDWAKLAEFDLELMKSGVLPIVTLILGYYFGTSREG